MLKVSDITNERMKHLSIETIHIDFHHNTNLEARLYWLTPNSGLWLTKDHTMCLVLVSVQCLAFVSTSIGKLGSRYMRASYPSAFSAAFHSMYLHYSILDLSSRYCHNRDGTHLVCLGQGSLLYRTRRAQRRSKWLLFHHVPRASRRKSCPVFITTLPIV